MAKRQRWGVPLAVALALVVVGWGWLDAGDNPGAGAPGLSPAPSPAPGDGLPALPGNGQVEPKEEPGDSAEEPDWRVLVSIPEQKVYVFRGQDLLRVMVCSTGTEDKPTPRGKFAIQNRGPWFFSEKYRQGGKWWVSFLHWGEYLFHSVPMDREGRVLEEEAEKLGQPASHGCVRLSLADARWFYDHIPQGTPVEIR